MSFEACDLLLADLQLLQTASAHSSPGSLHLPLDPSIPALANSLPCLPLLQPRTAMRSNYSHSQQRVRQILRDNEALVKRLG